MEKTASIKRESRTQATNAVGRVMSAVANISIDTILIYVGAVSALVGFLSSLWYDADGSLNSKLLLCGSVMMSVISLILTFNKK